MIMVQPEIRKIVILGAGRLAVNLSIAIFKQGYEVVEVCNRTESRGQNLAIRLNSRYVPTPEMMTPDADLYILAVSDEAIPLLLDRIKIRDHLIVHTSGSVNMDVLKKVSANYGIIYPPQTFTTQTNLLFHTVPVCIEASSEENLLKLSTFTKSLSEKVYIINSEQRKVIHLAAIFASNFTNFLFSVSQELLLEKGIDFRILEPIIKQTAMNASSGDISKLQTGPAIRKDMRTIQKHIEMLSAHPEFKEIYALITKTIIQRNKES
jgi:predicted short-subunit dehydrogenase-like oxidoreductase (DUF2520 family)